MDLRMRVSDASEYCHYPRKNNPMRILFLNYEYPPLGGGAANATRYLLSEYAKRNNLEVDLVTTAADNRERVEEVSPSVRIHYISINKSPERLTHQSMRDLLLYTYHGLRTARQLQQKHRYDIIHAFFGVPCGWMARMIAGSLPYIVSLRGSDVPGFSDRYNRIYPLLRGIIRQVWKSAAAVVANSEQLRTLALATAPDQRIHLIPNGVDTTRFVPRTTPRDPDAPFTVLAAARLMRRKGIRYALDAFARLSDDFPDRPMRMIIAGGDGDAADELRLQAAGLSCHDRITFTGHLNQDALIDAYQQADVFVFPSLNEGMSNNMLEALACGVPVIITRTGGSEVVTNGEQGFIVDRADASAIRDALAILLEDEERRERMGAAARARAEEYSWKTVADAYEKLYYDVINHRV